MIMPSLASCMLITLIMVVNAQSLRNITVDDTDPSATRGTGGTLPEQIAPMPRTGVHIGIQLKWVPV